MIRSRFRAVWLAPVLAAIALSAWAFASPIGASPDEDFHLASIWCANEARPDLCAPDRERSDYRLVPPDITASPCLVADTTVSGACHEWLREPTRSESTSWGNRNGGYPPV